MEKIRVMVVEDESIVSRDLSLSLKKLDYEVAAVCVSAEEALKQLETDRPDLVLMDIVLQGEMDGIEAAGHIRSGFNIPVIFLTAYADENVMQKAKITEPFGYLIKPFEDTELHFTIQVALYKHRMEERLRLSEEQYRMLVESANVIPWEVDLSTMRFTYVGPQAVDILGYPVEAWEGFEFSVEHIHPGDREWAPKFCQEATARAEDHEFDYRMLAADGRTVWLRDIVKVETGETGPVKIRGFMFDITDRKQVEKDRERLIADLQDALVNIKTLRGLLPICAWCKKIRDDSGYWNQVETYMQKFTDVQFTHGMCPECQGKLEKELDSRDIKE
jgi:PAS domain S-box-containing protein